MKSKKSNQSITKSKRLPHKESQVNLKDQNKDRSNSNTTIKSTPTLKVVLLGDSGVGKTCLRSQFIHHVFTNAYKATIGGDYLTTTIDLQPDTSKSSTSSKLQFSEDTEELSDTEENDTTLSSPSSSLEPPPQQQQIEKLNLQVWDTAGQERFNSISKAFYRGTDVCILCYDITNYESLLSLKEWFLKFIENCHVLKPGFLIVGNKCDKINKRVIDKEEVKDILINDNNMNGNYNLEDYIIDWNLDVIEVSAKNINLVNELFQRVGKLGKIIISGNDEVLSKKSLQNFDKIDLQEFNNREIASSKCAC
ncbi:hypothetical protein KGF54_002985 [Candida jiufengensis]|uniref:uncharacterized protein n=1 Tax=Candida jiufengensis TaxID=497108 RepID=UPI0022242E8D|nr:uncharacterized protein KGF54_002985 [Candida jiufengensis]KAI5953613.1 hypothetical protein KGF54_002985 [Candida jiufengensis]